MKKNRRSPRPSSVPIWRLLSPLAKGEAGQAMSEYALVVAALMGGIFFVGFNFIPKFIKALQAYYNGFFILLNIPFP